MNPYRYVPADEHLAALRDNEIYPNINRKDYAPTIYPPVAQMIFLVVSRVSETLTAMKVAMLGFDMLAIVTILALLKQDGAPPERVLVYAWHPLPLWDRRFLPQQPFCERIYPEHTRHSGCDLLWSEIAAQYLADLFEDLPHQE